mmetsp:Transcript_6548/g.9534  ORF Transcript_6548/g.9534 Transcript_6548/m.9534 type:complete len:222 (-) Transcript_6548:1004-1669(-)
MSSMRSNMHDDSMAVFRLCTLTSNVSQIPSFVMSAIFPVTPLIPRLWFLPPKCSARSFVMRRMVSAPQFSARVLGITSNASAMVANTKRSTPSMVIDLARRPTLIAMSTAPPPGRSLGLRNTLRATSMASCRLRSISMSTSLEAPRNTMVHAFGFLHCSMYVKYSSPILRISKRPAPVPMSSSQISSVRLTMVAPVARAMRLASVLRMRRMALMPALTKKC